MSSPSLPDETALDLLVVDDEPHIRRTIGIHLSGRGHRVREAATAAAALAEVSRQRFDVALLDLRLGQGSGLDLIPRLLAEDPGLKIVVLTAYASIESAVASLKLGARDYLAKPFDPPALDLAIAKMGELSRLERRVAALEAERSGTDLDITAKSPAMRALLDLARRAAASDARLLLTGENGTGKGLLARAIHAWSARRDRPFAVVACPALPADLLESELFGHVRGAFTGAARDNPGRVALAEGGTLLLDEIGDLPLALQPKLLRFIQDREYERVGDPASRHADVRILAATNQNLEAEVAAGRFREDLLYRLNVLTLELPPLRQRREDLPGLAEQLLRGFGREYGRAGLKLTPAALEALLAHTWPGNVRELRNALERAAMLSTGSEIGPELLFPAGAPKGQIPSGGSAGRAVGDHVTLAEIESAHIARVVETTGSLKEAAEILGIDPATLWRKRKLDGG